MKGSIHFTSDEKGKGILYPDNLTVQTLAKQLYEVQKELKIVSDSVCENILTKSAIELWAQTENQDIAQTWLPSTQQNVIPDAVIKFLETLLTGQKDCNEITQKVQTLVSSLGSDL